MSVCIYDNSAAAARTTTTADRATDVLNSRYTYRYANVYTNL